MEDKRNKITQKHKKLITALIISVVCFSGIVAYATHWEEIASIDWKEKLHAVQEKAGSIIEARKAAREEKNSEHKEQYECRIEYMSRKFPALMKVATSEDHYIDVPLISQKDAGYQTGCELVSAAMVLNYYEIPVTAQEVYEVIEKSKGNSERLAEDPNACFIGDPVTAHGFGCYVYPLVNAMNQLIGDDWRAVNVSDSELDYLEENYLNRGTPVIIWATINMSEPQKGDSWTLQNGKTFEWISGEHCLVLVGADEKYYYFNDPNHEDEVIGYDKKVVKERYEQLGKQAIIISR